jgi:hypothetical protein
VVHRARPPGRASATKMAIWQPDLVFGVLPRSDLVGGGGREIFHRFRVLGAGWRPVAASGVVWSWSFSPLPLPVSPGWGPWRAGGLLGGAAARASDGGSDYRRSWMGRPGGFAVGGGCTWRAAAVIVWRWAVVRDGDRSSVAAWASAAVAMTSAVEDVTCIAGQRWCSLRWDVGWHVGDGLCGRGCLGVQRKAQQQV